ncbi:hypothetical protein OIU85_002302 [Salix viminalis]|uniref:Uncharacterized protein n=1 Tax=Salix viminalis TaxID=40686 RepID=A0A9Q0ZZ08_SALVM|nr:hypothetical protein OIU85_002302 [Salix viminalis]
MSERSPLKSIALELDASHWLPENQCSWSPARRHGNSSACFEMEIDEFEMQDRYELAAHSPPSDETLVVSPGQRDPKESSKASEGNAGP